ncbi:hypothetical protein KVR01_003071 [Diaporthe batatas]|uniref:uncharacterized protein n=1 Tax=Diaporthe batatas TaxID=748121 RepID=UPI001D03E27F|nr:uncharacterized protein KVR01_003071 [Diaporthe batatas]KAG8167382.1 hypothetical protein KVR01_003071 [Diaporthe batatas]
MDHQYTPDLSGTCDPSRPSSRTALPAKGDDDLPDDESIYSDDESTCSDGDSICSECRQVDWDSLAARGEHFREESEPSVLFTKRVTREQLAISRCRICRVLSILEFHGRFEQSVKARPFSRCLKYAMPDVWLDTKTTVLQISQGKSLAVIGKDALDSGSRTIPPSFTDYHWLRHLAQSCEENHKQFCGPSSLGPVAGLKVIEASSRTVIEAPAACRYVALSYVWGQQPEVTQSVTSDLNKPPALIEDALAVTVAMGYDYLWIDKYCIPQNDNQERHRMINKMSQIYANASLTIVDASKGDACVQNGLPGVSSLARQTPNCAYIRNTAILEVPCGSIEVDSSTWATRGWTYQEGYFSKRRLIFTPSQVLFLCNGSYAEESICRLSNQIVTNDDVSAEDFQSVTVTNNGTTRRGNYTTMLQEYSRRDLTYATDSLAAFLGVLNFEIDRLRRLPTAIMHISCGLVAQMEGSANCLRVDLNWYHKDPPKRRLGFPTWSWAGWAGHLEFDTFGRGIKLDKRKDNSDFPPHLEWEISWKSKDHKTVSVWELANEFWSTSCSTDELQMHQQPDYPNRLDITCFFVPIRFQVVSLTEIERSERTDIQFEKPGQRTDPSWTDPAAESVPVLQHMEGVINIASEAYLDQDIHPQDCIIGLMYDEETDSCFSLCCLLARQLSEGTYERVGVIPYLWGCSLWEAGPPPPTAFLEDNGRILNVVRVSGTLEELLFRVTGERRTISLV